ncbi:MAG: sigma-70 family RNA polymerase sigma factor [Patescibacteria group bacterium]
MLETTDEQLIALYLRGHQEALEILIKRYLNLVYGAVYRLVSSQVEAEDITQETFIRAWKNLKKFDQQKNFRVWLMAIAKNAALDYLKKKRAINFTELENVFDKDNLLGNIADPTPLASQLAENQDTADWLAANLAQLTAENSLILSWHHQDGLTFKEISQKINAPLNTVKSRYRRALLKLKKILGEPL